MDVLAVTRSISVIQDLHMCSRQERIGHSISRFSATIQGNMKALQQFLPKQFSKKFRTPCWFSPYHVPSWVTERFMHIPAVRQPIFDNKVASSIIQEVFDSKSQHSQNLFCLPNVHLAGFPKCGTTALYYMIVAHPQVAKPSGKEGHFWTTFATEGSYIDKQIHYLWYLTHFKPAAEKIQKSPRSITIDGSPSTLWGYNHSPIPTSELCLMPSVISSVAPNTKFIVIMRDPGKRLHSDFWYFCANHNWRHNGKVIIPKHYIKEGEEIFHNLTVQAIASFQSCIKMGISKFECVRRATVGYNVSDCTELRLGIGLYYYHIVKWLNVVPRENFLFLRTEDLAADPYSVMKQVWSFLQLKPQNKESLMTLLKKQEWNVNNWIKSKKYKDSFTILPETVELLKTFYKPHNELLAQLLSDHKYTWNS